MTEYLSARKRNAAPGKHITNKNEGAALRRIMSQTGLTEAQVREHVTYRQQLAEARRVAPARRTDTQRFVDRLVRGITRRLKLAKEHPLVKAEIAQLREDVRTDNIRLGWRYSRTAVLARLGALAAK